MATHPNREKAPRFLPVAVPATQLHRFALIGASIELERIDAERARILESFPELRERVSVPLELVSVVSQGEAAAPPPATRRTVSPAQRKVISRRMRAYWAGRRKQAEERK
jgi:hypothetical protein